MSRSHSQDLQLLRARYAGEDYAEPAEDRRRRRGFAGLFAGFGAGATALGAALLAVFIPVDCDTPKTGVLGALQAVRCDAPEETRIAEVEPEPEPAVVPAPAPMAEPAPEPVVEPTPVAEPGPLRSLWLAPNSLEAARAHWSYASATEFPGGDAYVAELAPSVCSADVVVAIGSASADNETGRNDAFAADRAEMLAGMIVEACAGSTDVYALGVGGYDADEDRDAQRKPFLLTMNREGGDISIEDVVRELCAAAAPGGVASGEVRLSQYSAFSAPGSCELEMQIRLRGAGRV